MTLPGKKEGPMRSLSLVKEVVCLRYSLTGRRLRRGDTADAVTRYGRTKRGAVKEGMTELVIVRVLSRLGR